MKKFVLSAILCMLAFCSFAQVSTRKVTGRILDSDGEPMIGVSISAGTMNGSQFIPNGNTTTTNYSGVFTIQVPSINGGLKFSFIGMLDQTVAIPNGSDTYDMGDIFMSEDSDIVVNLTKTKKK